MLSPYKLCEFEQNYFEISSNADLARELELFFKDPANNYLWGINTARQRITHALRHTESIALRMPTVNKALKTTTEWNQVTEIINTALLDIPIFKKTKDWLDQALAEAGAGTTEFGRIFFSKHHANTNIDTHTDEGKYFSYYDRFHFVIDQSDGENIFHIRDEDVLLEKGKLYWVNNHVPHWLANKSNIDRTNLIFDARLL
jgi:mannose-6-phosphate isomerase-like protein (cupin superfamily)